MTDILCNWLNNEVKLSTRIDAANFAREFSTGYLIGEVLEKHQLQNDFDKFSQSKTADSKLNNFTRLEPILHLLEIPFDTNIARNIMTEKYGVATRLMYQIFIGLKKKDKNNLTGVAMETMRPAAPVKLEGVERGIYKEQLKHRTPRQTDLNLDALVSRFHEKQIQMEKMAFKERFEEEENHQQMIQEKRQQLIEMYKDKQAQKSEMLAKINDLSGLETPPLRQSHSAPTRAATVHIPKPPPNRTANAIMQHRKSIKNREAKDALADIDVFENRMERSLPPSKPLGDIDGEGMGESSYPDPIELIKPAPNDDYIGKIRKRLNEDEAARAEREKRRRKVLVDQLKAHEAQEEARREEMLVNRLMRQSQQERRIAVQLLHARHEKDVIRRNRLQREKQYEERRLKEFEDALNREAEAARLARLEYIEQTSKDRELHDQIAQERAEATYKKQYEMCNDILLNVVDFATKVGEYRELTNKLLPAKLMRDWTALFVAGQPLYETQPEPPTDDEPTPEQVLEVERQKLLDEGDVNEYMNMVGEWQPPESSGIDGPPPNNPIVGHIVKRLFDIVHPPSPPPPPPELPPFPIKACVLGKVFSGKTTCIKTLAENHRLQVLEVQGLVEEAIKAHVDGELAPEEPEPTPEPTPQPDPTPAGDPPNTAGGASAVEEGGSAPPSRAAGQESKPPPEATPDNRETEEAAAAASVPQTPADGMEKSDPEKPVPPEEGTPKPDEPLVKESSSLSVPKTASSTHSTKKSSKGPRPSVRAKLGSKAQKLLKRGKPVDDVLLVDILIDAIKHIPEETGWVLDGFPATYQQAKMLEKALSGIDAENKEKAKAMAKKSALAPDPRPKPSPPEPASGINVVVLLDIENELCLRRSAGRTYAAQKDEQYQQEFKPPPEGSATGIQSEEKVIPVEDEAHDMEQIQHRLTSFQDAWPKLEKWFTKFGALKTVEAGVAEETVYLEVEKIFEDTLRKLSGIEDEPPVEESTELPQEEEKPADPEVKPEETPAPAEKPEEDRSRPVSKKGSRAGSAKRSTSRGSAKGKSPTKDGKDSKEGKKSGKGSRAGSAKSPKRGKSPKKGKTPEPEPEPEPEEPPGTPPPEPGSEQWEFVDQPVEEELAHILAPQWETVENTYLGNCKEVMHSIRDQREQIIRYFYKIRKDFQAYLRRPDHKQEFVSQWQKEYNDLADDIREDEEVRSELHERMDDLRERLWSICDDRKEQAEKERVGVMEDGWLEDGMGLLTNHYITLMQAEVDRYQDTVRMIKDYYKGMEGKIPDELGGEYSRIPLVELPVEERPESGAKSAVSGTGGGTRPTTPAEEVKSTPSKSGTPSAKKKKGQAAESPLPDAAVGEGDKKRIPLVPRRPLSPDAAAAAKGKDKAKKGKGDGSESPQPPDDPDERLLFDAHLAAIGAVDKIISVERRKIKIAVEQAAREAEEEAERQRELEKEKEKEKAAKDKKGKGGKKGKSRSPSPKKGAKDSPAQATPQPPPIKEEESEEEKEKKRMKEKAKVEFFAAIEKEASAAKIRLDLAKAVAANILQDLKAKADDAYKDMNDWLGARFLKEMESIDQVSESIRNAIESGSRIREELVLEQEVFLVNDDVKVLKTPTPPPRPPPVEIPTADTFTVDQIITLYSQFSLTAPTGVMAIKTFQDMFADLGSLTYGTEQIPDTWATLSPDKVELLSTQLSPDGEYINWRTFLLLVSHPWPVPTQDELLAALGRFKEMDQLGAGFVTKEQYERVDLWFGKREKPPTPPDPNDPYPYDRMANLKDSFFDLFADHTTNPAELHYVDMLLYFCVMPDAYEGFLRALSVASGTHMPRLPRPASGPAKNVQASSRPTSQTSIAASEELEQQEKQAGDTVTAESVPETAINSTVPLEALHKVLHHGQSTRGDSHRFSVTADPEDAFSKERLSTVYQDLGSENEEPVLFSVLSEHPVIQDIVSSINTFKIVDIKSVLTNVAAEALDTHSVRTE